jgi:4-amino-4-deoxy-L-arabinose transferase-like glycosyltransferase
VRGRRRGPNRRFFAVLALIAVAAMGLRVTYVFTTTRHDKGFYDALYYELQATRIADGLGYTDPLRAINEQTRRLPPGPAADHPPLTVLTLVPVAWIFRSGFTMRLQMALLGTATVVLLGLLGRRLGGDAAGLAAAGVAAIYPGLWVNDGLIMSETVCALVVTLALLATYHYLDRPKWPRAALVGVLCGLAALARAELLLLAPLLAGGLLFSRRLDGTRARTSAAAALIVATLATMTPWFVYNQTRFKNTVLISTNDGVAMLGSNCDRVYKGSGIGLTDLNICVPAKLPPGDQSQVSRVFVRRAVRYIRDHKQRFPVVVAARIGRDFSVFRPQDMVGFNAGEGRKRWITIAGLAFYYPLVVLAGVGVVLLRRRGRPWWPVVAPAFVVIGSAFASYGQTRFRISLEPSIVVLSGVALAALVPGAQRALPRA